MQSVRAGAALAPPLLSAAHPGLASRMRLLLVPLSPLPRLAWNTVLVRKPKGDREVAFYPLWFEKFNFECSCNFNLLILHVYIYICLFVFF